MAVGRKEVEELATELTGSLRLNKQKDELFKAALALAYQVGVRDGYQEARDDLLGEA